MWIDDKIDGLSRPIMQLAAAGYLVGVARSYFETRDRLDRGEFDVVLIDFNLADGSDGFDVLRDLLSQSPQMPVALVTSFPDAAKAARPEDLSEIEIVDKVTLTDAVGPGETNQVLMDFVQGLLSTPAEHGSAKPSVETRQRREPWFSWSRLFVLAPVLKPAFLVLLLLVAGTSVATPVIQMIPEPVGRNLALQSAAFVALVLGYWMLLSAPSIVKEHKFALGYYRALDSMNDLGPILKDLRERNPSLTDHHGLFHITSVDWRRQNSSRPAVRWMIVILLAAAVAVIAYIYGARAIWAFSWLLERAAVGVGYVSEWLGGRPDVVD